MTGQATSQFAWQAALLLSTLCLLASMFKNRGFCNLASRRCAHLRERLRAKVSERLQAKVRKRLRGKVHKHSRAVCVCIFWLVCVCGCGSAGVGLCVCVCVFVSALAFARPANAQFQNKYSVRRTFHSTAPSAWSAASNAFRPGACQAVSPLQRWCHPCDHRWFRGSIGSSKSSHAEPGSGDPLDKPGSARDGCCPQQAAWQLVARPLDKPSGVKVGWPCRGLWQTTGQTKCRRGWLPGHVTAEDFCPSCCPSTTVSISAPN